MGLSWDNTLATGIDSIDNQHKELFERTNLLLLAMKDGKGQNEVIKTIDFLEEYAVKHFTEEEEIQKKNNYPNYKNHYEKHEEFKKELKELRKLCETRGETIILALNIQGKMTNWWKSHIKDLDKELGDFLMMKSTKI